MKRKTQIKSNTKRRNDFSQFIDDLMRRFEAEPTAPLQINTLSTQSGIEKRRLYDLMNVLVACGVVSRRDTHTFSWNGLNMANITLQDISKNFEEKSIKVRVIEKIFLLPDSPAIGLISTTFIAAYLYLGVKTLNIRDVALLMASDDEQSKPILRRLYLVAFLLERIGILTHSQKIGEYSINGNIEAITEKSLRELAAEDKFTPDSIEFQLSRFGENYMAKQHRYRQILFSKQLQIRSRARDANNAVGGNSGENETMLISSYAMQGVDA